MGTTEDELIGIPFPDHSNDLLSHLNEQRHSGLLCDITIKTQGLEYRTHRAVLAACSRYFRKLFTSSSFTGEQDTCELDFINPDALAALLEFAYTATLTTSNSNMRNILHAARLLEIQCVADACIDILRSCGADKLDSLDGNDLSDYEKSKQYLDKFAKFAVNQNGSSAKLSPIVNAPNIKPQKKEKRFLRPGVSRPNHLDIHENKPSLDIKPDPYSYPADDDDYKPISDHQKRQVHHSAIFPISLHVRENDFRYDIYPREKGPCLPAYYLPPSPDEQPSDDETMDADPVAYPHPVMEDDAIPGPDTPDKMVRKRRSQMPQECPVCHKTIHGAGKLPRHMRTHTGEKPFECEVCHVRFTRNDKLKIHMRKHTGERPYSCENCGARFLHSYDLKNHLYLHTGDRPFECTLCHKAFAREDHLQRHQKGQNCLEVRTRRRRRDDGVTEGDYRSSFIAAGLSESSIEDLRLSSIRNWNIPSANWDRVESDDAAAMSESSVMIPSTPSVQDSPQDILKESSFSGIQIKDTSHV
ncbi:zinc finger and BTB domain-containing protein 7B [Protopterus annectens]|uniref:zinc finger and BTB domain-containing protein 7B n=1 Tax=Protopterus annectens TaxID=7888 RepID=UPI001CFA0A1F|nr:zinc finger and BTB domain-containing protein 7B [Protopterus annectens]